MGILLVKFCFLFVLVMCFAFLIFENFSFNFPGVGFGIILFLKWLSFQKYLPVSREPTTFQESKIS